MSTTLMMASVSAFVVVTVVGASVVFVVVGFVVLVAVRGTHKTLNDIILYCLSHALLCVLWPALTAVRPLHIATQNGRRNCFFWGTGGKKSKGHTRRMRNIN